jgi:hypothetical protein
VVFDPARRTLGEEFYVNIDPESAKTAGLTVDQSTLDWWEKQAPEAKAALEPDQHSLEAAIGAFHAWWLKNEGDGGRLWSHGADFDNVLLREAYRALSWEPPWKFWNVRCSRTVLAIGNRRADGSRYGTHHNALHDAKSQALAVMAALHDFNV